MNKKRETYSPDILDTLANLSSDEVFTSPKLVNQILDLLPAKLFESEVTTFLDPSSKSGVFLREIVKRLNKGLEKKIPNKQERLNHIFSKQIYAFTLSSITDLITKRSLYGTTNINGKYSIFETKEKNKNVYFDINQDHSYDSEGKCDYCRASIEIYKSNRDQKEKYAYYFIHEQIKEIKKMQFDVIIGNPPYQLKVGVAQEQYAVPLYHKFVENAILLNPKYISMIIPSRWFSGGRGLDEFRKKMLNDNRIRTLHDFIDASECFPGQIDLKGGVCFFLWDRDNKGDCEVITHNKGKIISKSIRPLVQPNFDIFIRYTEAIPIVEKIKVLKEKSFRSLVSSQTPFGLYSSFKDFKKEKDFENNIKLFGNKFIGYINFNQITKNHDWIKKFKVLVPEAIGTGDGQSDWIKPILSEPGSACTQTYMVYGPFDSKEICENVMSYTQTKFFHFLLTLRKNTQHTPPATYEFIPLQDFNRKWDDKELYKKYNLTEDEIKFVESSVWSNASEEENDE
jgi:site-specific DNA-methyltransferase (adenine-specific)